MNETEDNEKIKNIKGLRNINEELIRQLETKKDYIADTTNLISYYDSYSNTIRLEIAGLNEPTRYRMTDNCHNQIGTKLKIPQKYYDYLRQNYPELLVKNINTLMPDQKSRRMIRTVDGKARAFLSDRYRPIDNLDVLSKVLHELEDISQNMNVQVIDSRLTENNLYIKVTSKDLSSYIKPKEEAQVGDAVNGGIIIANSETGHGSYKVMPFIHVLRCNNGMISDKIFKRVHLGKKLEEQQINWSELTNKLEDELLWSKLTDMIHNTFNRETFTQWIDEINNKAKEHIAKPTIAIEKIIKTFPEITEDDKDKLLDKFAEYSAGTGYTKWSLCQSVTDIAQTKEDYEKQIKYEKLANKILELEVE